MADFNALEALINAHIKKNGVQAITGNILNGILRGMVSALGKGYTIAGSATPSSDPGTMTGPVAYIAYTAGTYTHFDGLEVEQGEVAMLIYNEAEWHKEVLYSLAATATIDGNVGTPEVGVSFVDGLLTFDFRNMKGNPGNDGDAAGFGTINATVDGNIGTPGVSVQTSGPDTAKNITFQFTNLKGETGVTSVVATVDNTVGTPTCTVSLVGQQLTLAFSGLKGAQGDTGSSVDYPFTIVNNLTTNDATQALSAAMGVELASQVTQLEQKVDDMEVETNEDSDLDIIDENAYSIARFEGGHIKTKNFDSSDMSKNASDSSDFDIIDQEGHSIVRFENGHIKVKNFNSEKIGEELVQKDLDIFFNAASEKQHYDTVSSTTKNLSFPYDLKKDICFALKGEFSSFATITMGKGYNAYSGYWFVIDSTSVSLYYNQGSTVLSESVAHGLTFADFVKIVISNIGDDYCRFFIQTRDGQFAYTFGWTYAANGQAFFTTAGTLTNVDFIASCSDLKNDIWVFGDSYVGFGNPRRWPTQLRYMGYSDYLCDGLAGQSSSGAYADLQRCLALGVKPKILVWTLGMNDSDSAWNTTYQQVQTLCESNDITLVLATIPTVPSVNNENKNATVKNSGYDYIDFAKAVGANSSGVWYSGYLHSDEVHPTELGAKALATQFIFDFILKH